MIEALLQTPLFCCASLNLSEVEEESVCQSPPPWSNHVTDLIVRMVEQCAQTSLLISLFRCNQGLDEKQEQLFLRRSWHVGNSKAQACCVSTTQTERKRREPFWSGFSHEHHQTSWLRNIIIICSPSEHCTLKTVYLFRSLNDLWIVASEYQKAFFAWSACPH